MALLTDKDREFLRTKFEAELKGEVKATFFTQRESGLMAPGLECPGCEHTRQLLEEVTSLSPKLVLETLDFVAQSDQAQALEVDKIPATVLQARDGQDGGRLRFFGTPSGYEFATLIEDILSLSKGEPGLSPASLERLKEVIKPTHIQVFVTPT